MDNFFSPQWEVWLLINARGPRSLITVLTTHVLLQLLPQALQDRPKYLPRIAANQVVKTGKVIGVDMTAEMLDRARENAQKGNFDNVEFRLGEIENLPVGDNQVDAIISNCVINLSPNKKRVFQEAFRALRPGGRLMVSDIVLLKELPVEIKNSVAAYVGCVAGAITKKEYLEAIQAAGFKETKVLGEATFPTEFLANDPTAREVAKNLKLSREKAKDLASAVVSIKVSAIKPAVG